MPGCFAGALFWGHFSCICAPFFQEEGLCSKFTTFRKTQRWSGSSHTVALAMDCMYLLMCFSLSHLFLEHIFAAETHGELSTYFLFLFFFFFALLLYCVWVCVETTYTPTSKWVWIMMNMMYGLFLINSSACKSLTAELSRMKRYPYNVLNHWLHLDMHCVIKAATLHMIYIII